MALLQQIGGGVVRETDNEEFIEKYFRKLIAAVEGEREEIRSTWLAIDAEKERTQQEIDRLREDTEEWCRAQRRVVEVEAEKVYKIREQMTVMGPDHTGQLLEINCCGRLFTIPKACLCCIEGSFLNHMFSESFVHSVPRDSQGRYFFDFNPHCFALVVEYLVTLQDSPHAPPPFVPPELQQSMDILAKALNLKIFLIKNGIQLEHATSLRVTDDSIIEATTHGWQVIASRDPLPLYSDSYFEARILANPNGAQGGLAIGICGYQPTGPDALTIRLPHAVLYNSTSGLVTSCGALENVTKMLTFEEGCLVGVKHDIHHRSVHFYIDRKPIGQCVMQVEFLEKMRVPYAIFGFFVPGQAIQVNFTAVSPSATYGAGVSGERESQD